MAFPIHTISVENGSDLAFLDKLRVYFKKQIANAAGGSAGAAVTVAITGLRLPAKYSVFVDGFSQDATAWISNRTTTGFTVNIEPRLATNTLAAGTFDLLVLA